MNFFYQTKRYAVETVQVWARGERPSQEVREWIRSRRDTLLIAGDYSHVRIRGTRIRNQAGHGEWLVEHDGFISVVSDDRFRLDYDVSKLPDSMVLVYQPELTHSVWVDHVTRARTVKGLERGLKQGVKDGRYVAWRLMRTENEVYGNVKGP